MAALFWLIGGIALIAAEILSGDFFLLMVGVGALAGAGSEVIFENTLVSCAVFALVSIGLVTFARPWLKAVHVGEGVDLLEYAAAYAGATGLLFDTFAPGDLPGGTGRSFDWSRLTAVQARLPAPAILSGGLDPTNVGDAIRAVRPWAVDVSSGVEERDADGKPRRGCKDAARIAAFIDGVRNADA